MPQAEEEEEKPENRVEFGGADHFVHQGRQYDKADTLKTLQRLCRFYNVPATGSKAQILTRLSREAKTKHLPRSKKSSP